MKRTAICLGIVLASGIVSAAGPEDEVTLESAAPVVVKTAPEAGTADVDPGLTEIKITFSKAVPYLLVFKTRI